MDVLILTAFVSLILVISGILFFAWNVRQGTHEHSDRLVLLPLADDASQVESTSTVKEKR